MHHERIPQPSAALRRNRYTEGRDNSFGLFSHCHVGQHHAIHNSFGRCNVYPGVGQKRQFHAIYSRHRHFYNVVLIIYRYPLGDNRPGSIQQNTMVRVGLAGHRFALFPRLDFENAFYRSPYVKYRQFIHLVAFYTRQLHFQPDGNPIIRTTQNDMDRTHAFKNTEYARLFSSECRFKRLHIFHRLVRHGNAFLKRKSFGRGIFHYNLLNPRLIVGRSVQVDTGHPTFHAHTDLRIIARLDIIFQLNHRRHEIRSGIIMKPFANGHITQFLFGQFLFLNGQLHF